MKIKETREYVERLIKEINFVEEPKGLYLPIEYTMGLGGKRIRPVLCLMAVQLFGGDITKAQNSALALEVFHNFTLLHDDIMDNADLRRNSPTVHKKWDENTAILSGDAMMIKAYQMISDCSEHHLPLVLKAFSKVAMEVCEGQQYDMEFENRDDVTVDEYLEMIRLKTAVLLAGSLQVGAILADASTKDINALYNFGINIGLAFQLQDDYLDSFGNQETFGKKIGGDIVANKKTFLQLSARALASKADLEILNKKTSSKEEEESKIFAVQNIYRQLGVDKLSMVKMKEFYNNAISNIMSINGVEGIKQELIQFADKLINRNN